MCSQLRAARGKSLVDKHREKMERKFREKKEDEEKQARKRRRHEKRSRANGGGDRTDGARDHSVRRGASGTAFSWDRERDIERAGSTMSLKQSQQLIAKAAQLGSKFSHASTERNFL